VKLVVAIALACGCGSALHEPPPIASIAPGAANGRSPDELEREADAAWKRRGEPGQAKAAQDLYLDAAAGDAHRVDALEGAMAAISFRLERESNIDKSALSERAVELGQWCQRRAPAELACDYRLATALGQQAREHHASGKDALDRMVALLRKVIAGAPQLDDAGAHRVLALVLLRAPAWPAGPGDPDAALDEARAAVKLAPRSAANQLALAEALAGAEGARAAYQQALDLATAAKAAGDPDADAQIAAARAGLAH
jgi:hypothetical protein